MKDICCSKNSLLILVTHSAWTLCLRERYLLLLDAHVNHSNQNQCHCGVYFHCQMISRYWVTPRIIQIQLLTIVSHDATCDVPITKFTSFSTYPPSWRNRKSFYLWLDPDIILNICSFYAMRIWICGSFSSSRSWLKLIRDSITQEHILNRACCKWIRWPSPSIIPDFHPRWFFRCFK